MGRKLSAAAIFTCVLLASVFIFAGCAKPGSDFFNEISLSYNTPGIDLVSVDGSFVKGEGSLALFSKVESASNITYTVYNVEQNKIVGRYTSDGTTQRTVEISALGVITVKDVTNAKYSVYDIEGKAIADKVNSVAETNDLVIADRTAYRIKDGVSVTSFGSNSTLASFPNCIYCPDEDLKLNNYLAYLGAAAQPAVCFYNDRCELRGSYIFPSYAVMKTVFALGSGDALIQFAITLPDTADRFDFMKATRKYQLVTMILKPDGSVVKLNNCNVIFTDVLNSVNGDGDILNKSYENIVVFNKIDEYLYVDTNREFIGAMNNKGAVSDEVTVIENGGEGLSIAMDNGATLTYSPNGKRFNTGKGGNVFNSTDYNYITSKYIINDKAIYDYSMKALLEFDSTDYRLNGIIDDSVVLGAGTDFKNTVLYRDGSIIDLKKEGVFECITFDKYVCIRVEDTNTRKYFDASGKLAFTSTQGGLTSSTFEKNAVMVTDDYTICLLGDKYIRVAVNNSDFEF